MRCKPSDLILTSISTSSFKLLFKLRQTTVEGFSPLNIAFLTASLLSNSNPGKLSVLAKTRNTFQAGRHSPNGLAAATKLCTRPSILIKVPEVSLNGAIGNNTSALSNAADLKTVNATTHSACAMAAFANAAC